MSTLFTLSKSPLHSQLEDCAKFFRAGDSVLFLEEAVYYYPTFPIEFLKLPGLAVYFLKEDLAARGIDEDSSNDQCTLVDSKGYVELCVKHDRISNWF